MKYLEESGRFQVCLEPEKAVSLKLENLRRPCLGPGDSVEVSGLESESGKLLNGQRGIVTAFVAETGRFQVRFELDKVVNLKPENIERLELGPGDTVDVSAWNLRVE